MAFTGHVELMPRRRYPPLEELPEHLEQACLQFLYPYVGTCVAEKNCNKLLTSNNHLNDHVLRVRCFTPPHMKDIAFTLGITDFDEAKGRRVNGNAHAYIQSKKDRFAAGKSVAEMALDMWECKSYFKNEGTEQSGCRHEETDTTIPPMPSRLCPVTETVSAYTLADFDGTEYGEEYISFEKGVTILMHIAL